MNTIFRGLRLPLPLTIFIFTLIKNFTHAQQNFSYKRELTYLECNYCNCIKSRKYKILSSNLSDSRRECAERNNSADISVKELLQGGSSGTLFGGYIPQEGCSNNCSHDYKTRSIIETTTIKDCDSDSETNKAEENSKSISQTSSNKDESETKASKKFTGVGTLKFYNGTVMDGVYNGPILDGEPNGIGQFELDMWKGYLTGNFKGEEVSNWKFVKVIENDTFTTKLTYRNNIVFIKNGKIIRRRDYVKFLMCGGEYTDDIYFDNGNWISIVTKEYQSIFGNNATKYFKDGSVLNGRVSVNFCLCMHFPFNLGPDRLSIEVFDRSNTEIMISGEGELKYKNGLKIVGKFENDALIPQNVKMYFENGDYYNGGVTKYLESYVMHGEGVLTKKGEKPKKGIWSYGEFQKKIK